MNLKDKLLLGALCASTAVWSVGFVKVANEGLSNMLAGPYLARQTVQEMMTNPHYFEEQRALESWANASMNATYVIYALAGYMVVDRTLRRRKQRTAIKESFLSRMEGVD